jgi:hypothetical protein
MDEEIRKLLERQAEWQKSRAKLSWAEKVRMAEAVREDVARLREHFLAERRRKALESTDSRGGDSKKLDIPS